MKHNLNNLRDGISEEQRKEQSRPSSLRLVLPLTLPQRLLNWPISNAFYLKKNYSNTPHYGHGVALCSKDRCILYVHCIPNLRAKLFLWICHMNDIQKTVKFISQTLAHTSSNNKQNSTCLQTFQDHKDCYFIHKMQSYLYKTWYDSSFIYPSDLDPCFPNGNGI